LIHLEVYEDIGQLKFGSHMLYSDISFGLVVSQEVMTNVYVLCSRVVYGVISKLDCPLIVTQEGNLALLTTKVSQSLLHPKQLGTAGAGRHILGFSGGKGNGILFLRTPGHQRPTKKLASP
jgi:hypothetical protein